MNDLTPKELYDQRKKEKLAPEKRSEQFYRVKKIAIWLIMILLAVGGIYWFIKRSSEKIAERKIYAVEIPDQGRNHIDVGAPHPAYRTPWPLLSSCFFLLRLISGVRFLKSEYWALDYPPR